MRTKQIKFYDAMIEDIKVTKTENIGMSFDWISDYNNIKERSATLLYVPDSKKPEHYHISLTDEEIKKLYDWCGKFLKMKSGKYHTKPIYET